jgi:hypothetical protein
LDGTEFYLISNPMRPNGGILARDFEGFAIPLIGITFYGPTENSCPTAAACTSGQTGSNVYHTVDVAQQYDLLGGDSPAVAWNVLAWANSGAAYYYLHGDVPSHSLNEAISQGTYGDTDYYLLPSNRLPILLPLQQVGVPDPLLAVADAPLRVLIESAYYRGTSPGESVSFQLLPQKDVVTLLASLAQSIPVGIDDGLEEAGIGRVLGTNDVNRPFGVGGETYNDAGKAQGVESHGVWSAPVPTEAAVGTNSLQTESSQTEKTQSAKIVSGPATGTAVQDDNKNQTEDLGNVVPGGEESVPAAPKPRPLQIVRDSLNFDPSKPLAGLRPSGDGPLKRIVNALTGQQPPKATDTDAKDATDTSAPAA